MIRLFFFWSVFLIFIFSAIAVDDWTQYGKSLNSTHTLTSFGSSLEFNSLNFSFGQSFEPVVADITADSGLEMLIWENNYILVVRPIDGELLANHSIDGELIGQPAYYNGKVYALAKNNSDGLFYKITVDASSLSLDKSIKLADSNDFDQQGVKCVETSSVNYCTFMDVNNTIYRVDVDSDTYTTYQVTDGIRNTTASFLRVPAIADIDGDADFEAVFSFMNVTDISCPNCHEIVYLFVYDIDSNAGLSNFGENSYVRFAGDFTSVSSPLVHNFDGGFPETVVTLSAGNVLMKIANSTGDIVASLSMSNNYDISSQLFVAVCDFNTTSPEAGVGFLSANTGNFNDYRLMWVSADLASHVVEQSVDGAGCSSCSEPIQQGQIVTTADLDGSGSTELIATFAEREDSVNHLGIFSCDEESGTEVGDRIKEYAGYSKEYIPIVAEFNDDVDLDLIVTSNEGTSVYSTVEQGVDVEILDIVPIQVIQDVDMVLGKTGLVRVTVKNNGLLDANASVSVTFEGAPLNSWGNDTDNKTIVGGDTVNYDFSFKPENVGLQTFSAKVSVS